MELSDRLKELVGMGKLGARELNVSSDIDLIYVYDQDGETTGNAEGRGKISNQEYFGKVVRALYTLVGDTTEHGFVFPGRIGKYNEVSAERHWERLFALFNRCL